MSLRGIQASGHDIWGGGVAHATVPRASRETVEKLLGKRGSVADRHSLAAVDLLARVASVRALAAARRCRWDEIAALVQLVVRGVIAYAPL
eukprot:4576861-Heterocapsa_arctica.AAC.1